MLEFNSDKNTWTPPDIGEEVTDEAVRAANDRTYGAAYLHIFRTQPYIDSLYIRFGDNEDVSHVRRFTVCDGYTWDNDAEEFFHQNCVKVLGYVFVSVFVYQQVVAVFYHLSLNIFLFV